MLIGISYAPPLRRWHIGLVSKLAARGHQVQLEIIADAPDAWGDLRWHFTLERRLYRARHDWFEEVEPAAATGVVGNADLFIVLAGAPPAGRASLQPRFNGQTGEGALRAALLGGHAPLISIVGQGIDGVERRLAAGLPAIEDRYVLARSLEHVLPRLATLLVEAVTRLGDADEPPLDVDAGPSAGTATPLDLLRRGVSHRLRRKIRKTIKRAPPDWRMAFRLVDGPGAAEMRAWPSTGFTRLEDPEDGFHADPFAFEHAGANHLFFEDFPSATRKGVISHVEIDVSGRCSAPRRVLEQPTHLSYPLVLSHEGEIYMLPETSGARRLQLFRADPFPDRWIEDHVLLDDTVVADATPILHEGRWWIFASLNDDGGSSWDQLALYSAPDLLGPWSPHRRNPVLIDAGAARPAGAMWHEDGTLMRVAQDCRAGYGKGIALCRVDRLDPDGFAQTVVARLGAPLGLGAFGAHTLNRSGRLEVIDLNCMPD